MCVVVTLLLAVDLKLLQPHPCTLLTTPIVNTLYLCNCSASGGLKICSVDSKGYFVKIVNTGNQPEQLNGCNIQQSVNDRLVAAFKFPNGVTIDPGQTITVSKCV